MPVVEDLYKPSLESLGEEIAEDGTVQYPLDENTKVTIKVGNHPLVLPIRERLRASAQQGVVLFHPLSENVIRGESPVLRRLRMMVVNRLTETIALLAASLIELATDLDQQQKLKPSEAEFLSALPSADTKLLTTFSKVVDLLTPDGDYRAIKVFFKRGGVYKGEKRARVAVVSFPIVEALYTDAKNVFGVPLRVADKKQLQALFEYILPGSAEPGTYNYGSDNKSAPYYDALMRVYVSIAERLNVTIDRLAKASPEIAELRIDTSWAGALEQLDQYALEIPPMPGNEGDVGIEEKAQAELNAAAAVAETHVNRQAAAAAMSGDNVGTPQPAAVTPTPPAVAAPQPAAPERVQFGNPAPTPPVSAGYQPAIPVAAPVQAPQPVAQFGTALQPQQPAQPQTTANGGIRWGDVATRPTYPQPAPQPAYGSYPPPAPTGYPPQYPQPYPGQYGAPQQPAYGAYGYPAPQPAYPPQPVASPYGGYQQPAPQYGGYGYPAPQPRAIAPYAR